MSASITATAPRHPYRMLTADEVLRMVDDGILRDDEHVELIDGVLLLAEGQGPYHSSWSERLLRRMERAWRGLGHVRSAKPLAGDPFSLPEPDLAVVRGRPLDYMFRHPTGADTLLVAEIAWTSQGYDRDKLPAYARIGVPVHWLVDLKARVLEVRTGSSPEGTWADEMLLDETAKVELPALGRRWRVRNLMP